MKAVILCAGLGTRLRPLTNTVPKVMIEIGGKPLLQHHVEWLVGNGIRDIGINLFYLPDAVTEYFGDGSKFGARIYYSRQPTLSETASGFKRFENFVGKESCLVIYGDNFFSLSIKEFANYHKQKGGVGTIALKEWENPGSKGIVGLDADSKILWFKEKPQPHEITTNVGNAGIYMVEPEIFSHIPSEGDFDFGKQIFPEVVKLEKGLYGYHLSGHHVDIGTHEALEEIRIKYPQLFPHKAVFLDRDGVLNKKPPEHEYVSSLSDFSWNEGAMELIKSIKSSGFSVVVVSNQQGIAKGKTAEEFVRELHLQMNEDLKKVGTFIDAFYYCPHFDADACSCRKPQPGLFFKAAEDMKIDLKKSWMIGDSQTDYDAGSAAGCRTFLVQSDSLDTRSILQKITDTIL